MSLAWRSPFPPAQRVGAFVADTPACSWMFRYLQAFPASDIVLFGGTVRDALLGRLPAHVHVFILTPNVLRTNAWLAQHPAPTMFEITLLALKESSIPDPLHDALTKADFTMNAMGYSVRNGQLHDPFDGISALQKGTLRTIESPATQFRLRPLQLLRAIRLSIQFHLTIDSETWTAIQTYAKHLHARVTHEEHGTAVYKVPRHQLFTEKLLALHHHPKNAWKLFDEAGLLPVLLPHVQNGHPEEQILSALHDDYIRQRYANAPLSASLTAAGLFAAHPEGEGAFQTHARRFHAAGASHPYLSFDEQATQDILQKTRRISEENPDLWSLAQAEKIVGGDIGAQALALTYATSLISPQRQLLRNIERAAIVRDRLPKQALMPKLLRGRDLLPLGIAPGPALRLLLQHVRNEQLKGALSSHEDALQFAHRLVLQRE